MRISCGYGNDDGTAEAPAGAASHFLDTSSIRRRTISGCFRRNVARPLGPVSFGHDMKELADLRAAEVLGDTAILEEARKGGEDGAGGL